MSVPDPASVIDAGLLIHRIEQELAGCRAILARVESVVETLLRSGNVAQDDPLHLVEMQSIDLLDQILGDVMLCLQDFAGTEAIKTAASLRLGHVTRRLRLAALRNRLAGSAPVHDAADAVELF